MFCRGCGESIPVDSVFCPSCGKNLLNVQSPDTNTRPSVTPSRDKRRFHIRETGHNPLRLLQHNTISPGADATPARSQGPRAVSQRLSGTNHELWRRARESIMRSPIDWKIKGEVDWKSWRIDRILFYGGIAFGVVGFVTGVTNLNGIPWLGFGIVLVLSALYWQRSQAPEPTAPLGDKEMTE